MLIAKQELQTAVQGPLRLPVLGRHWELLLLENILPPAQTYFHHLIPPALLGEDGLPAEI